MKNERFVAGEKEPVARWYLRLPVPTTSASDYSDALLEAYTTVTTCLEDVVSVTEVEVSSYSLAESTSAVFEAIADRSSESTLVGGGDDAVTRSDIETTIAGSDGSLPYVQALRSRETRTQVYLEDGRQWVGSNTPELYKKSDYGTILDETPQPPMYVYLGHNRLLGDKPDAAGTETGITVSVSTRVDIWLQETPLGRINRARLAAGLTALADQLPAYEVRADPGHTGTPASYLESLLSYDGPPARDLIAAYEQDSQD